MRDILTNSIIPAMTADEERIKLTGYKSEKDYSSNRDEEKEKKEKDEDENELIEVGEGVLLTKTEAEWWRKAIIYVSIATIIPLSMLSLVFLGVSFYASSAAALSLSFDMLLDASSSGVVVWRFYGSSEACGSPDKERRTVIVFAFLFIVFGLIILVKGVITLVAKVLMSGLLILTVLSTVGAVFTTILVTVKIVIAKKLNSQTMYCDAFSSGMGAITGFSILASTIAYATTGLWCLDGIVAVVVAVTMVAWGIWLLIQNVSFSSSKKETKGEGAV
ncbi:transmembrane protein 163a-like [Ptychodera flava]|uniref:transmembrane protein 163a-like n=1 Tax=Ptychodera flava TaxID=63121 RepID=UPI00396A1304